MKKLKRLKGWGVVGFLLLFLSSTALAAGINFNCTGAGGTGGYAQSNTGSNLNTSSVVQVLSNGSAPDPVDGTNFLHVPGTETNRFNVGDGTGGAAGTFSKNYPGFTTSRFLRVWENGGPAAGRYYITLGSYPPGELMPNDVNFTSNFRTAYLAAAPAAPDMGAIGEALARVGPSYKLTLTVNYSYNAATKRIEIAANPTLYRVEISKYSDYRDITEGVNGFNTDNTSVSTPDNPYFVPGHYYIRVRAYNYFGPGAWASTEWDTLSAGAGTGGGNVYNLGINFGVTEPNIILAWKATGGVSDFDIYYTTNDPTLGPWTAVSPKPTFTSAIPAGDTTLTYTTADFSVAGDKVYYRVVPAGASIATSPREVAGKINYILRRSTVTATGVNSFALPFSANWVKDPTAGTTIYLGNGATARAALGSAFEFIGGWDIATQRDIGVFPADSAAAATAFNIEIGRGYQIGITGTTDLSWTVIGIK